MKRPILIVALAVVAVGAVAVGAYFLGFSGAGDRALDEDLGDLYVANMELSTVVSERSCECLRVWGHDEEDVDFCLRAGGVSKEEQAAARACVVETAADLGGVPTQSGPQFVDCGWEARDETLACIDAIEKEELCDRDSPLEATMELLECVTPGHWERWADCMDEVDGETRDWLEAFSDELERRECLGERSDFDGGSEEVGLDLVDDRRVDIGMGAVSVDGRQVMDLSRGGLDREADVLEPLEPLMEPFEAMSPESHLEVSAHSLVPYRTMLHVFVTATEAEVLLFSSEPVALDGSEYDKWFLEEMPSPDVEERSDVTDNSEDEGDTESLGLTILVAYDGVYVTTKPTLTLPPLEGCGESGPTVCLVDDDVDPEELIRRARVAYENGESEVAAEHYDEAVAAYDFRRLYNLLSELSDDYPGESVVRINAEYTAPTGLVHHVMETAAVRLAEPYYDDDEAFRKDRIEGLMEGVMFPDAAFAVTQ